MSKYAKATNVYAEQKKKINKKAKLPMDEKIFFQASKNVGDIAHVSVQHSM